MKKSVVPPIQLARNGEIFVFPGLIIFPEWIGIAFIRITYLWDCKAETAILSHENFNQLINN